MHPLDEANQFMEGAPGFTAEERERIREFQIPDGGATGKGSHVSREIRELKLRKENREWYQNHAAKLAQLEYNARKGY